MEWQDRGIVLSRRPHGETSLIVSLLTESNGRHVGLVRGGTSRRFQGVLEPGNGVVAHWRARLAEHLGSYTVEIERARVGRLLSDPLALQGLAAACAVAEAVLPEREAHPGIFAAMDILLDSLEDEAVWPVLMIRFEIGVLSELGYALDLSRCAVTGAREALTHVSPRSGRAVSAEIAAAYEGRLLALPPFLLGRQAGSPSAQDVLDGLKLTGHFLFRHMLAPHDRPLPEARARLYEKLAAGTAWRESYDGAALGR